jgi:hypothetical protein
LKNILFNFKLNILTCSGLISEEIKILCGIMYDIPVDSYVIIFSSVYIGILIVLVIYAYWLKKSKDDGKIILKLGIYPFYVQNIFEGFSDSGSSDNKFTTY